MRECVLFAEANKIEIVQQGAVASLLKLTRVHDPRVQRNAAGALLNLTHIGWSVIFTLRGREGKQWGIFICTIVLQECAHGQSTLQACQKGGWVLFQHLPMKEHPSSATHCFSFAEMLDEQQCTTEPPVLVAQAMTAHNTLQYNLC